MERLNFSYGNAKLSRQIAHFSLPSGFSCPCAKTCQAFAARDGSKLTDGQYTQFRCYSASQEIVFPNLRKGRWQNFEALKKCKSLDEMVNLIHTNLQFVDAQIIRIHIGGDFYSQMYFDAWMEVARKNPSKIFYSYTKSIKYWVKRLNSILKNFILTASYGGTHDHLIKKYKLKSAEVVFSLTEAEEKGLEVDKTDELAYKTKKSFALLLHGVQPVGTLASKAYSVLKALGLAGYNRTRIMPEKV